MIGLILATGVASAQEQAAAGTIKCTCNDDRPSYSSLNCPTKAPADPSPCERINRGLGCKTYKLPKGLGDGFRAGTMESFLLRHALGWEIQCAICASTGMSKKQYRDGHKEALDLEKDMRKIGGKRIHVAMSPNFVMISDIRGLKIATRGGGARLASRHELLHLYLQRAEMARRDFIKVFGEPVNQRSAMVIVKRDTTRAVISKAFFGSVVNVLRGGGSKTTAGGYAGNGFTLAGTRDDDLHFRSRHMIGHLLISCYQAVQPHRKYCPHWMDAGCAHWLCKLHPRARDFATFCQHEGAVTTSGGGRGGGGRGRGGGGGGGGGGPTVSGSGSKWDKKAAKIARRGPRRDPVEAMFQAQTAKQMDFDMHVRSWSWFDVFAAEESKQFVDFIQRLRGAEEPRIAAKAAWGQPPEIVDDRWRERVTGKRRDVAATKKDEKNKELEAASDRELKDIALETDIHLLASRIRGLEFARNVATARLLLSLADSRDSHRVREVIALILERTDNPEVLKYLRGKGYKRAGKIGRATLCRVFGVRKYAEARAVLRKALSDGFWLVKANAARALAQIGDKESMPALAKMAAGSASGKLRCAAMDALALFGKDAESTITEWERNLMHPTWQVKVATCDAFRTIGSTNALDMLIGRLDSEGGRVHDEIRISITDLTGMDREWTGQQWIKWWNHTKKFKDLEKRMKEVLDAEKKRREQQKKAMARNGNRTVAGPGKKKKPTYYGIKVYARAVGYVLDTSASMRNGFRVSAGWEQRLGRKFKARTRIGVCKEELAASIKGLDPRTRLNLYLFNTKAKKWKPVPVAAGAMGANAISKVNSIQCERETNYFDALRLVLGMEGEGGGWRPNFADTPDTLLFLTDGTPTDGEITKADELLAWFTERNRFARLRVNVVAMGNTGVDTEFLRKFAEQSGGKFVHLTGDY